MKLGKRIDMIGQKYGRLTVVAFAGKGAENRALWRCRCDCGNEIVLPGKSLRTGNTKSCGCLSKELSTQRIVQINHKHGETGTRLFRIWTGMLTRCYNPNATNYQDYGGRGIVVCNGWRESYEAFRDWAMSAGYTEGLTLDRKDNDRGYFPDNCRWATHKQQANNRRSNVRVSHKGESYTVSEWADIAGMKRDTLAQRLNSGHFSIKEAIEMPVAIRGKYSRFKPKTV